MKSRGYSPRLYHHLGGKKEWWMSVEKIHERKAAAIPTTMKGCHHTTAAKKGLC
ncbi:MAG TPA: hypothetical protein VN239_00115 [Nitrososphaera sp.]|nr:hypothetical protein [Nitrososphaera sp.]